MADWRQIQARIRKAKNSPDAQAKLNELFQRTRDAMVAWELGAIEEKAEHKDEAGNWYKLAAQRFRRADWRKKAEEALTRLGFEIPPPLTPTEQAARPGRESRADSDQHSEAGEESSGAAVEESEQSTGEGLPLALGEIPESHAEGTPAESSATPGDAAADGSPLGKRKRRRGRRGGRGRRRKGAPASPGLPSQAFAQSAVPQPSRPPVQSAPVFERSAPERSYTEAAAPERMAPDKTAYEPQGFTQERTSRAETAAPRLPSERAAHGRGDPALASRMAQLESLLRRLVTSPLHRLEEAEEAPAGPGVFLLSDSDQITSYYVEACQTLRIGAGNLVRGGRSGKTTRGGQRGYSSDTGLKAKLAEYLGISEAKVSQYMKDHCVLRWIQLDDDAPLLAHFAIGVLRTPLNLD
ncbi:MAG TPA: hypothetical protein VN846_06945 [Candidatus Cybelea sp.]|jgi:hypothetical protein|nr:hypothetical protein [Candidatus Cybelea sp.]